MKMNLFVIIIIFLIPTILAVSNESVETSQLIDQAKQDLIEMQERQISVNRINESYQEALQLYDAQMALEKLHKEAKFDLIIEYTANIAEIKKTAFRAQDELNIFIEVFNSVNQSINLSSMFDDYSAIILSFKEERFEDTIELIEEGYNILSEIQSSQTALNLFYVSTTRTLKNFFRTQWKTITFVTSTVLLLLFIFWNTLSRFKIRINLQNFILQKKSIKRLIKQLQSNYFIHKNISTSSYNIKLNKFESMILDINRQIPLLKEDMVKLKGKRKVAVRLPKEKKKAVKGKKSLRRLKKRKKR